jgi:hypothetical protein
VAGAGAAETPAEPRDGAVLPVFTFRSSHGYSVIGLGVVRAKSKGDRLLLLVGKRDRAVTYVAPAEVSRGGDRIAADLGSLGRIDLDFVASGSTYQVDSPCGREGLRAMAGRFEGTVDFRGEEAYTEARSAEAQPYPRFLLELLCLSPTSSGFSRPGPGGLLTGRRSMSGATTVFRASARWDGGRSHFRAEITERRGPTVIERAVEARGAAALFNFPRHGQRASASPPPPFSGSVRYRGGAAAANRWSGSLEVDFPGHSNVRLAGRGFSAGLVHARFSGPVATTSAAAPPTCLATLGGRWTSSFRSSGRC